MFFALFSLLVHAKNIKVLAMDEQFQGIMVNTSWRWIMYALFSRVATTSIHSFKRVWSEISTDCGDDGLMSVAGAKYPRTQLLEDLDPSEDINTGRVHLAPGTRIQMSKVPSDCYRVKGPRGEQFEVIRQLGANLDVIVPTYGPGFVDCDSCPQKRQRTSNDEVARTIKPSISHLDIVRGGIKGILPHFGTNLLSLRIILRAGKGSAIDDHEFARIFSCCPRLVYLELERIILESLRPLTNAYFQGC